MKKNKFTDYPLLADKKNSIPLFYPHIPKNAKKAVCKVLSGRWLGQGPLVDDFEKIFSKKFCGNDPVVAVGAGTDALHLSYILGDIKKGDEVICPVFTCTATNIPLLYVGATIIILKMMIALHSSHRAAKTPAQLTNCTEAY